MGVALNVRRAVMGDAGAISELHIHTWRVAYDGLVAAETLDSLDVDEREARWRSIFAGGEYHCWVAEDDAGLMGFAAGGAYRGEQDWGELYAIYVHPNHWGSAAGQTLLDDATAALTLLWPTLALWVLGENARARRFYERNGWVADNERKVVEFRGATLDEVRYVREAHTAMVER